MRILVVDDEQDICEILQYNLETEGYEVLTANSAEEAMDTIQEATSRSTHSTSEQRVAKLPDLLLLDVMMGEMSGFQMARRLKDNPATAGIPIIFITALDGEDNTVRGLNIGADDYIAKPLSMKEVKARVKAVLRRTGAPSRPLRGEDAHSHELRYEGIVLNLDSKTATMVDAAALGDPFSEDRTAERHALSLTKLEFELLALFLENPGKVFGRNDLLELCWPEDVVVLDRTVDVNITRLRKKIGRYGKQIKTRVGYGYYFDA